MERSCTCKGGWEGWKNQFLKISFDGFLKILKELVVDISFFLKRTSVIAPSCKPRVVKLFKGRCKATVIMMQLKERPEILNF